MNALKKSLDHLAHQLSGISRAQKISGGILVTLTIVAVVIFKQYESAAQMQPILDQRLSADESKQIVARLKEQDVPYKIGKDKKILVPAERKLEVLADLGYTDLLPGNTEHGFDKIINQSSVWDSSSKTEMMYKRAKEATLANIIGRFPNVKNAVVMIDSPQEQRIGETATPTASVNIFTEGEVKDLNQLAAAAASVLAGAQADLKRDRIEVTIDGASFSPTNAQANAQPDPFDRKQKIAKELAAEVMQHLAIPNVLVTVSVDLTKRPMPDTNWYGPSLLEDAPAKRQLFDTVVSASINVPRSYFANIFRSANPNAKEPDDAILRPVVTSELEKIRHKSAACLGLKNESLISVDCYADAIPASVSAPLATSATPGWSSHLKQVAFGALIVVSLLMLSLLVRKNHQPRPATVLALPVEHRNALPDYVDAEYVDHDDEMMSHVKSLVDENPDQAALMVRRWLELKR